MATLEITVPDIGDFKDIPVIEILVKPGDVVDQGRRRSSRSSRDKATMEVPSPHAGHGEGDEGEDGRQGLARARSSLLLDAAEGARGAGRPRAAEPAPAADRPRSRQPRLRPSPPRAAAARRAAPARPGRAPGHRRRASTSTPTFHAEVLVLGSGPGGYTAAFRAADLGKKVVLVERYPRSAASA